MTNNANDKDKDQFRLLAIAMQLPHRSLQPTTLPCSYICLSYCEQWQLKPFVKVLLDRFQMEVESDTQQEEPNKEQQSETLDDEA